MKVSIIIPIYNVEKYVERCLESVASQSFSDIECILVDDKGSDYSYEIVNRFLHNYKGNIFFSIYCHEKNLGLSAARNTGIQHASGDYMYFLDSDDSLPVNAIKSLVETAESNDYPEIIMGITRKICKDGSFQDIIPHTIVGNENVFSGYLENKWYIIACNKLIRKDIFTVHHTTFVPGITHEDVMWSFEISTYIKSIVSCPKVTYNYCLLDNNSISRSSLCPKRVTDLITILEYKAAYWGKTPDDTSLAVHIKNDAVNLIYALPRNGYRLSEMKSYIKRIRKLLNIPYIKKANSTVLLYKKAISHILLFLCK